MITDFLARIFGTDNARQLDRLQPIVVRINYLEESTKALTDEQLRSKTDEFRQQLSQGTSLDDILPEAFAVVREVSRRTLGQRHYDVQLIGGMVLHSGKIAEMKTGEGKTLTATLPLYLNALVGKSVHLVTTNDYLARRDSEWMSPIFTSLGMTVGCLQNTMNDAQRKQTYNNDILYATNNELGFDYLRDNMKFRLADYVQKDLHYAIVDEIDSILIDEARTPLIISGAADKSSRLYQEVDRVIRRLKRVEDFEVDEKARTVQLTEIGNDKLEQAFNVNNLYALENITLLHHCMQSVKAHALFHKDVEYAIKDGQVLIVDEFTGRILPGRRYSDGLHQAIEAKEGVEIERESQTLASITLQNYFRLYKKLAGMTGTAATEAEEFHKIYKLSVVSIPTNKPMIRKDEPDLIFLSKNAKYQAIVEDIKNRHVQKQPILIGTISIETSELLSTILKSHGIQHEVLNAKQHAREADIVAQAGEPGHVTIATNMAGRGTDIKLNLESVEAGGLYILGTERHESRRIDNQLRGRSGRQGDPGESRFYISLEDDLIRIFSGDSLKLKRNMERFGMKEDEVIESPFVSKQIERSQEKVEKQNFEIRKNLLEYDDVLNQQRMVVYTYRREILEGEEEIYGLVRDLIAGAVEDAVAYHTKTRTTFDQQRQAIFETLARMTGLPIVMFEPIGQQSNSIEQLTKDLINYLLEQYALYRGRQRQETIQQAEKWLLLDIIDGAWKQHMFNLDHLKEGIGLRGWGQKNPLLEYKREAFDMFQEMMQQVKADIVHHIFHLNLEKFNEQEFEERREQELDELSLNATAAGDTQKTEQRRVEDKIGRNDPCSCNSGKKFKKCCGA